MPTFNYRTAPTSFKLAATAFLLLAAAGLGVAALQIYVRTGLTHQGALLHYRGDEATLQYPMSFAQMVEIAHAHAFTLPLVALVLARRISRQQRAGVAQAARRDHAVQRDDAGTRPAVADPVRPQVDRASDSADRRADCQRFVHRRGRAAVRNVVVAASRGHDRTPTEMAV